MQRIGPLILRPHIKIYQTRKQRKEYLLMMVTSIGTATVFARASVLSTKEMLKIVAAAQYRASSLFKLLMALQASEICDRNKRNKHVSDGKSI